MYYMGKNDEKFVIRLQEGYLFLRQGEITTSSSKATSFTHREMTEALKGKTIHIKERILATNAYNKLRLSVFDYAIK